MRSLEPDNGAAVDFLYLAYEDRLDCGYVEFRTKVMAWELAYIKADGFIAGVAMRNHGELHIGILPAWRKRWATRSFIRRILEWAGETGPVSTGVMANNLAGKRLVEGVGFRTVESNARGTRYELSADAI